MIHNFSGTKPNLSDIDVPFIYDINISSWKLYHAICNGTLSDLLNNPIVQLSSNPSQSSYCEMPLNKAIDKIEDEGELGTWGFHPRDDMEDFYSTFTQPCFLKDVNCFFSDVIFESYLGVELFISGKHTSVPYHYDFGGMHTWLAQMKGNKKLYLIPPHKNNSLIFGKLPKDFNKRILEERKIEYYECILEPGQSVFIPSGWLHAVENKETSYTLSISFINEKNFSTFMGCVVENLPNFINRISELNEKKTYNMEKITWIS